MEWFSIRLEDHQDTPWVSSLLKQLYPGIQIAAASGALELVGSLIILRHPVTLGRARASPLRSAAHATAAHHEVLVGIELARLVTARRVCLVFRDVRLRLALASLSAKRRLKSLSAKHIFDSLSRTIDVLLQMRLRYFQGTMYPKYKAHKVSWHLKVNF